MKYKNQALFVEKHICLKVVPNKPDILICKILLKLGTWRYEYKERFIEHSLPNMLRCGFVLSNVEHNSNFLTFMRNGELIDIDIVKKDWKCMAGLTRHNRYNTECNSLMPYLRQLNTVRFLDRDFLVPGEDYFEFIYSKTWKIPQRTSKVGISYVWMEIRRKFGINHS